MLNIKKIINKFSAREEQASKHINVMAHYDDQTLIDKSGKLIQIIKVNGIDFATKDELTLDQFKWRRNNLLKTISSEFAVYFWQIRRQFNYMDNGCQYTGLPKYVNDKYLEKIQLTKLYFNELYIAIITKQSEGFYNKAFSIFKLINYKFDKEAREKYLKNRHGELNEVSQRIINSLKDYQCELLCTYYKDGVKFSKPLCLISQLLNYDAKEIPIDMGDAAKILPVKRLFFNHKSGAIELRSNNLDSKFLVMLSIKTYSPLTSQDILNQLSNLKCEYTITQSFRFYDRYTAKRKLRDQQNDMLQIKDESVSQTEQIDHVFDDTASGAVNYGIHHFTMAIFANSQEELKENVSKVTAAFTDVDIICVREDSASECAFWSQLPGNFGYIMRPADISTKNLAALASLHNTPLGFNKGNHWGDAVTIFETLSGSPYYFNFHYKDIGNFLIFGASGSGKTVLVGFLILQSMKFGGKRIIFDKDRGLEILVRAMRGKYERLIPGIPTGFNPCQLPDSLENRTFLTTLFKKILSVNVDSLREQDFETIQNVISGIYRLPKDSRQFRHVAPFFGPNKDGSLRKRFDLWHSDGPHAWLFDNSNDSLNLESNIFGFDLTHIMQLEECKVPALMYLTYRVEGATEGNRSILFYDEGWNLLNDDFFKYRFDNEPRTQRKKNNIFGLATQVANDTVNSCISKAINESSFCKIFFPNSSADKRAYVDHFGLSEHEYEVIKTLPDDQHYFLLNYGRSVNKQSVIVRINLEGLDRILAIISARESTLKIFDEIISQVGDDPDVWLPIFYERLEKGKHP